MEPTYQTIILMFRAKNGTTHCTFHNITEAEALSRINQLGYVEPKWYEFWKDKLKITKFS
jgi:hypothetical protein